MHVQCAVMCCCVHIVCVWCMCSVTVGSYVCFDMLYPMCPAYSLQDQCTFLVCDSMPLCVPSVSTRYAPWHCLWAYQFACLPHAGSVHASMCVPLWVTVDTSRRQWLLSSNREQPLTHSLIRIMLTLLLPTKNICLFNQSLLNSLHLFSQWERMGLLSHVCTLGFYEVGPQALSILSQGDSSRDNPQPS